MFGCCCQCLDGAVIDRWLNQTQVRKTLGCDCDNVGTVVDADPFARWISGGDYVVCTAPSTKTKVPPDCMGDWLMLGDANGWPSQVISSTVDDILACAANDSTHTKLDHNCYVKSGTVDLRQNRRGRRSLLAKKYWHGKFRYNADDLCALDPTKPAEQTKYRSETSRADIYTEEFDIINTNPAEIVNQSFSQTVVVDKASGIKTKSSTGTLLFGTEVRATYNCTLTVPFGAGNNPISGTDISDLISNLHSYFPDSGDPNPLWDVNPAIRRTGQKLIINSSEQTDTHFLISWYAIAVGVSGYYTETRTYELKLDAAYSNSECLADFYAAMRAWNLANSRKTTWMKSEVLALSPLAIYDEIQGPVSPIIDFIVSVDDYSQPKDATDVNGLNPGDPGYIPTWHQRAWFDPAAYTWQTPTGSRTDPPPTTGGSTLIGPAFSGEIIAAGVDGSERMFWFNCTNWERVFDSDLGDPAWHWNQISKGATSDSRLPETTRRWMSPYDAQYDGAAFRRVDTPVPTGNYPQAFLHQQNGLLKGAKYIEATQNWPAVDFNYPCGDARFDVDQTTVCCIVSGDDTAGFRVKQTGNSTSTVPSAGQTILVEGWGIYPITSVTSEGGTPAEWTIHVGAKVEDVPVGRSCWPAGMDALGLYSDGSAHLGKLRWWTTTPSDCVTPNPVANNTGVRFEWTFDQRAAQLPTIDQPNWLGGSGAGTGSGIAGCTGLTMSEFSFTKNNCPAVVGWVPFYAQTAPLPAVPEENFSNQTLFQMPAGFNFDDTYGALWIGAVEMVMPDPFWQTPFTPDCGIDYNEDPRTEFLSWAEDNGSGAADYDEEGGTVEIPTITHHAFYPHRKWVAARCTTPAFMSLPSGISLFYATGSIISPADGVNVHYDSTSGGVILGADDGSYRDIERPWGFTDRACTVDNRFGDFYTTFTQCP